LGLMLLSTFIPSPSHGVKTPPAPSDLTIRHVVGADAQQYVNERVRKQLEQARKEGFKVLDTSAHVATRTETASLLDRLVGAHADTFVNSDGVVVFTVLDDGDYSNVEYSVYYHNLVNNFEVWGNQQMDLTTGDTT